MDAMLKHVLREMNSLENLDNFVRYVSFVHYALLLKMFHDGTDYSQVNMDITSGIPNTIRPETPRIVEFLPEKITL